MTGPRVAVVLPVRDGAQLLAECLALVMPQATALGAEVIVVDDASTDDTAAVARRYGADVRTQPVAGGPYLARNAGWEATDSDIVVFTDVRARPHPGWLGGVVAALESDPSVAVAGGDVFAQKAASVASRVFARRRGLSSRDSMSDAFLPYLSTCNLATRRTVLDQLGGFRALRSGGDLDFCWRAQLEGCGRLQLVEGAGVDWVARDSVKALLRQIHRYGAARPHLDASFAHAGKPLEPPPTRLRWGLYQLRLFLRTLRSNPRGSLPEELVLRAWDVIYWEGYRRSWAELHGPR